MTGHVKAPRDEEGDFRLQLGPRRGRRGGGGGGEGESLIIQSLDAIRQQRTSWIEIDLPTATAGPMELQRFSAVLSQSRFEGGGRVRLRFFTEGGEELWLRLRPTLSPSDELADEIRSAWPGSRVYFVDRDRHPLNHYEGETRRESLAERGERER